MGALLTGLRIASPARFQAHRPWHAAAPAWHSGARWWRCLIRGPAVPLPDEPFGRDRRRGSRPTPLPFVDPERDLDAVREVAATRRDAAGRDRQAHRRPGEGDRPPAGRAVRARALPVRRRAGSGEDAAHPDAGRRAGAVVRAHPVHARSDAGRHHRHRRPRGGSGDGPARVPLRARADLRARRAGRRGEPHAAQDPGGAAAVDAGVPRVGRAARPTRCRCRSWCSRRRTRSSRRAPTRCPRRSSIASCSRSTSATRRRRRRCASSTR